MELSDWLIITTLSVCNIQTTREATEPTELGPYQPPEPVAEQSRSQQQLWNGTKEVGRCEGRANPTRTWRGGTSSGDVGFRTHSREVRPTTEAITPDKRQLRDPNVDGKIHRPNCETVTYRGEFRHPVDHVTIRVTVERYSRSTQHGNPGTVRS